MKFSTFKFVHSIVLAIVIIFLSTLFPAISCFVYVSIAKYLQAEWYVEGILGLLGTLIGLIFPLLMSLVIIDILENPSGNILVLAKKHLDLENQVLTKQLAEEIETETVAEWLKN